MGTSAVFISSEQAAKAWQEHNGKGLRGSSVSAGNTPSSAGLAPVPLRAEPWGRGAEPLTAAHQTPTSWSDTGHSGLVSSLPGWPHVAPAAPSPRGSSGDPRPSSPANPGYSPPPSAAAFPTREDGQKCYRELPAPTTHSRAVGKGTRTPATPSPGSPAPQPRSVQVKSPQKSSTSEQLIFFRHQMQLLVIWV